MPGTATAGTLEQQRAGFALARVEQLKARPREQRDKFKTQLIKLPARLHTSGLGQTVALYLAAGRDRQGNPKPEVEICDWLEQWLRQRPGYPTGKRLIDCLVGNGVPQAEALYRRYSVEVRALAVWLKRFAEAFLEGEAE